MTMMENGIKTREPVMVTEPTVIVISAQQLDPEGVRDLSDLVALRRPDCFKIAASDSTLEGVLERLLEHPVDDTSHNELLAELAGKGCYLAFGKHSSGKDTPTYLDNTLHRGDIPHRSIAYHAKMTFYFAGISRRMLQELVRNYVGSDREVEGSPSVESTRYVEHSGRYVVHPRDLWPVDVQEVAGGPFNRKRFASEEAIFDARVSDATYQTYLQRAIDTYKRHHDQEPKGMARKRIYEAASGRLAQSAETSLLWTTNPAAIEKLLWERGGDGTDAYAADLEFQRFAAHYAKVCLTRWPALFSPKLHAEAAKWIAAWVG